MPELDFAVLCEYVRQDEGKGVGHLLGGGLDTIEVGKVPSGANLGLWARILVARNECDRPHRLNVIFQDEDGERLVDVNNTFVSKWIEGYPVGWKIGAAVAFNLGVPLPREGRYSIDILINDNLTKTIPFRVVLAESDDVEADKE